MIVGNMRHVPKKKKTKTLTHIELQCLFHKTMEQSMPMCFCGIVAHWSGLSWAKVLGP